MFYTVKEVAKMLRSSEKYIYSLIQKGIIPAIRLESKILIEEEKLKQALAEMEMQKEVN